MPSEQPREGTRVNGPCYGLSGDFRFMAHDWDKDRTRCHRCGYVPAGDSIPSHLRLGLYREAGLGLTATHIDIRNVRVSG